MFSRKYRLSFRTLKKVTVISWYVGFNEIYNEQQQFNRKLTAQFVVRVFLWLHFNQLIISNSTVVRPVFVSVFMTADSMRFIYEWKLFKESLLLVSFVGYSHRCQQKWDPVRHFGDLDVCFSNSLRLRGELFVLNNSQWLLSEISTFTFGNCWFIHNTFLHTEFCPSSVYVNGWI